MSRFDWLVLLFSLVHYLLLLWVAAYLPIGESEAKILYEQHGIIAWMMQADSQLPVDSFLSFRLPFLLIHAANIVLFFLLAKVTLHDEKIRALAIILFMVLPGVVSSALLASTTGLLLLLFQLFLNFYLRGYKTFSFAVLAIFMFIDKSSVILYSALLVYAVVNKERLMMVWLVALLAVVLFCYGYPVGGKPKNYFGDTIGLYAAIFSPLLFLYFFYVMYRYLIKSETKNIIWMTAASAMMISLMLAIRQRIHIQDFAPFVVPALLVMVENFYKSYRVRLSTFRSKYTLAVGLVLATVALNTLSLLFHRPFFLWLEDPRHHFAYNFYVPYWLANELKRQDIHEIHVNKREFQWQLHFYGIADSNRNWLQKEADEEAKRVSIRYKNRMIAEFFVSKINK